MSAGEFARGRHRRSIERRQIERVEPAHTQSTPRADQQTPGRTQLLNFFDTSLGGRLVDLPGYGYARVAKTQKHVWEDHVDAYLAGREQLVATVLVMDVRHAFEPFDVMMIEWTQQSRLPMHVLLNKADKLKHGAQRVALRTARRRLSDAQFSVQLFSAQTGLGRDEAISTLRGWLTPELGRTGRTWDEASA
jgi:GTP-binding protein